MSEYAILHSQICDNYEYCPAKIACDNGGHAAIYFLNNKISIRKEDCIGCGVCITHCGLFRIVENLLQECIEKKRFRVDPRNTLDLTVERFGCDVLNFGNKLNDYNDILNFVNSPTEGTINILEFVDSVNQICPFQGIEVASMYTLFPTLGQYRKYIVEPQHAEFIRNKYSLSSFPAILLIQKGEVLGGPIMGTYCVNEENERVTTFLNLQTEFAKRLEANI